MELPLASQIKGLALIQEDGHVSRLLPQAPRVAAPVPGPSKPSRALALAAHGVAPPRHRSPPPVRRTEARSPQLMRGLRAYGVYGQQQRQLDRPAQYRKSSPWRRVDHMRKAGKLMMTPGR